MMLQPAIQLVVTAVQNAFSLTSLFHSHSHTSRHRPIVIIACAKVAPPLCDQRRGHYHRIANRLRWMIMIIMIIMNLAIPIPFLFPLAVLALALVVLVALLAALAALVAALEAGLPFVCELHQLIVQIRWFASEGGESLLLVPASNRSTCFSDRQSATVVCLSKWQ